MKNVVFWIITRAVWRKSSASEEHIAFIFMVEGKTSKKPAEAGGRLCGLAPTTHCYILDNHTLHT
jgi:hypothetical protein